MHEFNQSLRYDKRMYAADIAGSIAYAKGLARVGILTQDEQKKIVDGLSQVGEEWKHGKVSSTRPTPRFHLADCVFFSLWSSQTTKTSTQRTSVD